MNIHEYQAKKILYSYGIPMQAFAVVGSEEEAQEAVRSLQLQEAVVKVQILAGGRGKAGGVRIAKNPEEILATVRELLGKTIINRQTGPRGLIARKVLISPLLPIEKEYYLGVYLDPESALPEILACKEGGTEIEETAAKNPDAMLFLPLEPGGNLRAFRAVRLCKFMGWEGDIAKQGIEIVRNLGRAFVENDASLIEINPLVLSEGSLWALDAKMRFDDNALFRHPSLASLYDPSQYSQGEVEARKYDLAYVSLEGDIGCMVNGAGLAMATMDLLYLFGGRPANFLDVGGGSSREKVAQGFKIILEDSGISVILVNIFGGIMDCAVLADGIVHAVSEQGVKVPIVVRMEGTNVEQGKRILQDSGLPILSADSLSEAAEKAVALSKRS